MTTKIRWRGIVCLAACSALAWGPCVPGEDSTTNGGGGAGGGGPPPMGPRPSGLDPVPPVVLECRPGPEPAWQVSLGSVPGLNACMGSLLFRFGPLELETGVAGGDECGPGCALALEETLVPTLERGLVSILRGHEQTRFGWSPKLKAWVPEPYLYVDLVGYERTNGQLVPLTDAESPEDFRDVAVWVVIDREGGTSVYVRSGDVFRIAERNDALAAMDKRASAQPPPMFGRGRTVEYVRRAPGDQLIEVRDYRYKDGITAAVIQRSTNAADAGRIEAVAYDVVANTDAAQANRWFRYGYDPSGRLRSVAVDANDPSGQAMRDPIVLEYDGPEGARVNRVTSASGAVTEYGYQGGRAQRIVRIAQTRAEDETLTFTYACAGAWCPVGVVPDRFTEIDDDGFLRTTEYTPFPGATPLAAFASQVATGTAVGAARIDPSSVVRTQRDGTGTLRVRYLAGEGIVESWNTDGRPAGGCASHRIDRDVDAEDHEFLVAALSGALPSRSVSEVDYDVTCFDDDNLAVVTMSSAGRQEITYQKAAHPDPADPWWNELGWAALLPARIVSTSRDARHEDLVTETTTHVAKTADGTPCGAVVGAVPALPDAAFALCSVGPMTGGPALAVLDRWLRPIALNTAQDIGFKTTTYHPTGHALDTIDPTAARTVLRKYSPIGQITDERVLVCGTELEHRTGEQTATLATSTETVGGLTAETRIQLGSKTGRTERVEVVWPGYTKTQTFVHSATGDVVIGRTDAYSETHASAPGGSPLELGREAWGWSVRGHR